MKALILVDLQLGLIRSKSLYKKDLFIDAIQKTIRKHRAEGSTIVFVQHNNKQLIDGTEPWKIDPIFNQQKEDLVVQKWYGDAFQETELKARLTNLNVDTVVIGGIESQNCVKATCLGSLCEGFNTLLLKNGHTNWRTNAEKKIIETEKDLVEFGVEFEEIGSNDKASQHLSNPSEMTTAELGQLFPIIIHPHSEEWARLFKEEKEQLMEAFPPGYILDIDHIGSTSIPGIKAKPTIDLLMQIADDADLKKMEKIFQLMGYQLNRRPGNPPPRMTFVKGYSIHGFKGQTYHVHLRYKGNWKEIRFRDYLKTHMETALEYEKLKIALAEKYRNDRETYTNMKSEFIEKINKLAEE